MKDDSLPVMTIRDGSLLGAHLVADADLSIVAHHITRFVARAGHLLTPELRDGPREAATAGPAGD
ncbi:hypothetical protein [Streptomyces sp. ST2-7A]|uniref:hypothetical protein n=1 Tax=Streptomyces sp. ST2-7A TaxID=2907214 RepID=UPI001F38ADF7|nr:hypothetical protein [Streptomyces sp. ST2-7A]MCE7081834.1 hypothetical protein [Streptomyces sp. ST2-7A]